MGNVELNIEQKILIETQVSNNKKSAAVAFLLWFCAGAFGGHNFYLGRTKIAIFQLIICIFSIVFMFAGIGMLLLGIVGIVIYALLAIWIIVEAFFIPAWIRADMEKQREIALRSL